MMALSRQRKFTLNSLLEDIRGSQCCVIKVRQYKLFMIVETITLFFQLPTVPICFFKKKRSSLCDYWKLIRHTNECFLRTIKNTMCYICML